MAAERRVARALPRGRNPVDPLERVLDLDESPVPYVVAAALALLLHGTAAARAATFSVGLLRWAQGITSVIGEQLAQTYDVDVAKPPEPEPPKDEPKEERVKEPVSAPPKATEPPPAPAQAGQILAQQTDPNEPVDLTNSFVTGGGTTYAGGTTQSGGTSKEAVKSPLVSPSGVPGGKGSAPQLGPDLSRPPSLSGSTDWKCPFPAEADAEQIDEAFVTLQVAVNASGRASSATVLSGGDHGFGREARQCALRESYNPAFDRDGKPISGTKAFRIHFER